MSSLLVGRWRSPSVVEGFWLLTGWRSFRSTWRLSSHPPRSPSSFFLDFCASRRSGDSTISSGCSTISWDIRGYLLERLLWKPGVHLVTVLALWLDGHWLPRRLLTSLVHSLRFARSLSTPRREATVPSVDIVVSALHSSLYHSNIYSRAWPRSTRVFTPIHGRVPRSLPSRMPTILALCSHDVIKLEYWAHVG